MFHSCLLYYFEGLGVDFAVSNDTSSVLANLTYDLISIYIDAEFIDSTFETLNLLFRDGNGIDNSTTVIDTQFIMVERDGSTRNGLVAQCAQLLYSTNEPIVFT